MLGPGQLVRDRYEIERSLGRGGGGEVWLGRDRLREGRVLALKGLPPGDDARIPALEREFAALADLRHPNLGEILGLERDPALGRTWLLAPWYPGGDLEAFCARSPAPSLRERLTAAVEVLRALAFLHERGVVHGDVKPGNVLLDENGRARLVDLGVGAALRADPGSVHGTPAYLAPELLRGELCGPAADVYGFGVLLARVLGGRLPFAGDAQAQLRARAEGVSPDLSGLPPEAEALAPVLRRLLAARPGDRPADGGAALAGLVRALPPALALPAETLASVFARADVDGWFAREEAVAPFEAVLAWLAGDRDERPPTTHIVAGLAGSGRSSLLRALRRRALLRGLDAPETRPPEAPDRSWLWLGLPAAPTAPTARSDADDDVDRLGQAVLRAASERPMLLAVDDVDRAAPAVRALLAYLARTLPDAPEARLGLVLGLGGTHPEDPELLRWLGPYEPPRMTWLRPLGPAAVARILERVYPAAGPTDALAQSLHRSTGGNPALLQAQLRALLEAGVLPVDDRSALPSDVPLLEGGGAATALAEAAVPATLEEAAARRLESLTEEEVRTLEDVARLSPPTPRALLRPLSSGAGLDDPLRRLVERELLVVEHGPAGATVDLVDAALRALLRRRVLSEARLRSLVERVGAAAPDDARRLATLLAELGDAPAAARQAFLAGRRLLAVGAAADARVWLRRALDLARQAGLPAPEATTALAEAEARAGDPRAAAAVLTVAAAGESAEARAARVLRRAEHLVAAGDHREALEGLASLVEEPSVSRAGKRGPRRPAGSEPPDGRDRRDVLAARAHLLLGEHAAAEERASAVRARVLADPGGNHDRDDLVRATTTLGLCGFYAERYEKAVELLREARALIEAGAAPEERPFVLSCQGMVLQRQGDLVTAAARYRESGDVARLRGDLARVAVAAVNLGTVAQETGDLGAAIEAFEDAARSARRLDNRTVLVKALLNLGNLRAQVGALDGAAAAVAETLRIAAAEGLRLWSGYGSLVQAEIAADRDRPEDASQAVAAAREHFAAAGAQREALECDLVAARTALARGDVRDARRLADTILREGGARAAPRFLAWGHFLAAEAEWRRWGGDETTAIRSYRAALAAGGGRARPEDRWRVHAGLARILAATGDTAEAGVHARTAVTLLDRLRDALPEPLRGAFEAAPGHARAREALAPLLSAPPAPTPPPETADGPGPSASSAAGPEDAFLQRVLDLNKRLATEPDADGLLRTILDVAISLTGAERGFVLLPAGAATAEQEVPLKVRVARNIDRETIIRGHLKVSASIAREVFLTGSALLSVDATEDERLKDHMSVAAMRLRSVLCVPLRHRDAVIGVIYIDNRFQRGAFRSEHLARLAAFADQAALALANAQARERELRTREELEATQREVEALNERLERELSQRTAALADAEERLRERRGAVESRYEYGNIIGRSPVMRRLFAVLDRVTESTAPLLVTGESGTGKELVARAVHYNGPRRRAELVAVNCAALPETLLESELFGHARGAFTGADRDRPGILERAQGGTLFLDEIGDMSLSMQVKLLRFLESGEFKRLGETALRHVDVRLVAATNRDLRTRVREGAFREDLLFRVEVVSIELPPLREREGDLPLLVVHFLAEIGRDGGTRPKRMSPDALALLERYAWPGNVRELESTVTTLALLSEGDVIAAADVATLRPRIADDRRAHEAGIRWDGRSTMVEVERAIIDDAVRHFGGKKAPAARALGLSRNRLYARLGEGD